MSNKQTGNFWKERLQKKSPNLYKRFFKRKQNYLNVLEKYVVWKEQEKKSIIQKKHYTSQEINQIIRENQYNITNKLLEWIEIDLKNTNNKLRILHDKILNSRKKAFNDQWDDNLVIAFTKRLPVLSYNFYLDVLVEYCNLRINNNEFKEFNFVYNINDDFFRDFKKIALEYKNYLNDNKILRIFKYPLGLKKEFNNKFKQFLSVI